MQNKRLQQRDSQEFFKRACVLKEQKGASFSCIHFIVGRTNRDQDKTVGFFCSGENMLDS
jgi:hypothetical protein